MVSNVQYITNYVRANESEFHRSVTLRTHGLFRIYSSIELISNTVYSARYLERSIQQSDLSLRTDLCV